MTGPQDFKRWLLAAAVTALASWFLAEPQPVAPLVAARSRDSWSLPELPRWTLSAGTPVLVAEAGYWEKSTKAAEVAEVVPADARWRLAGVVGSGDARKVLVAFGDQSKPPQLLKLGEALPSGHRITRIDDRAVCVALGKRSYTLALERLDQEGP